MKKKAYVMLRIVSICNEYGDKGEKSKSRLENKISVSLNRQKPIDLEDLAFNSELVYAINNIEMDNSVRFTVCRKGDSRTERTYLLTQIARFVLASKLQKPGSAKNMYSGNILKMNGDSFKNKEVFPQLKNNRINDDFLDHFGLVNISKKLYDGMEISAKKIDSDDKFLKNGHYYFIAIVVRALFMNHQGVWEISIERIQKVLEKLSKTEVMDEIYEQYTCMILSAPEFGESKDYSDLKKDTMYQKLIDSKEYKTFRNSVRKIVLEI